MPKLSPSQLPQYCRLSGRNLAFYWKNGNRIYLPGKFNSPESLQAYREQMDAILEERVDKGAGKKQLQTATVQKKKSDKLAILEMVTEFLLWGETYYVKGGKPTGTVKDYALASKPLVDMYGELLVEKFVQMDLIGIQEHLVKSGISRGHINQRIKNIKRIFNWAAGRGLISHNVAGRWHCCLNIKKTRKKRNPPS